MGERTVGRVTHYYERVQAAAVSLTEPLRVGDHIHIVGHTTDLTETVDRIQIEHADVKEAQPGEDVAIQVSGRVRAHDEVRKIVD